MNNIEITGSVELDEATVNIITRAVNETLAYEEFTDDAEVSVNLVDNSIIKELNKQYRNKDTATDVLSFNSCEIGEEYPINPENNYKFLGDIVISVERAAEQAYELEQSIIREIAFLTIHSVLHLLFYDHELSKEDENQMIQKQKEIIKRLGF